MTMRSILLSLPIVLTFAACAGKAPHSHEGHHDEKAHVEGDKAKDPVCGMEVAKATAKKSEFDKADYFFCSDTCLASFKAAPTKYAKACTCAKTMKHCDCEHCEGKREPCDCGR